MTVLLDVNVLVALIYPHHGHHQRAQAWFGKSRRHWATCPSTQSGFLRVAAQLADPSRKEAFRVAFAALEYACQSSGHEFWPMTTNLLHLAPGLRRRITGHRQIPDVLLLALAEENGGQLATFDQGIVTFAQGSLWEKHVLLIP